MGTTAGTVIDSVARRVRDANNTAHSRTFVRGILDRLQVLLNGHQKYVLTTTTITATTDKTLYSVETDIGSSIEVLEVSHEGQELDETSWRNLHRFSPTYLTDKASQPGFWAKIGRSLFALYPRPTHPVSVEVTASKITTALSADAIPLEMRDEDVDVLRELTAAILLLRQRDLDTVPITIQRMAMKLSIQVPERRLREGIDAE